MEYVEGQKSSVAMPMDQPSSGSGEKTSGLENETVILVHSDKDQDSLSNNGTKEGGGYASYAVSQSATFSRQTVCIQKR